MQPNGEEVTRGVDAVAEVEARSRFRRRRVLNLALSAITVAAVVVGAALALQGMRRPHDTVGAPAGSTVSPAVVATTPIATSPAPTSEPASPPPATTTSRPPVAAVTAPDLHATAPSSVALHPDGGVYRGKVTVTLKNSGSPYPWGHVYVTLPPGVEVEFAAGDPGFNGCMYANGPQYYGCVGPVVPGLGGVVTNVVHLKANYAPQPGELTLGTFSVKYEAMQDSILVDPTPSDNTVTVNVTLAP